jgi:tetratricopeptide (TPR) repeat protein
MERRESRTEAVRGMASLLLSLSFYCSLAAAQEVPGYPPTVEAYDPREVAMLPRYCIHTQLFRQRVPGGDNREQIELWRAFMGPTFDAMHHYCWGLMKTNRAILLARGQQARQFYLNDSINEFDFVLRHAKDDFILLPEILTKRGENLIRLGRGPVGILDLERAAELKPDYWPPYAHMSDFYLGLGEFDKAREQLTRGLQSAPDAAALKRRLAELDRHPKAARAAARAER